MKISICSKKEGLDSLVDERFGRTENFTIIDLDTMAIKTIKNNAKDQVSGAGGEAVKLLSKHSVDIAIVPHLGPKAETAMEAFEIKTFSQEDYKSVGEVLKAYQAGKLKEITKKKGLTRV
ncbi:MAG: NifB/NifX family molybdenum-iron cluster-binding protein [Psychrilyobacter sp.]|nr:NifB/NifX family molybdenum-iron cluster-binding protein [Psychrilyobacter sp.]